MTNKKNYPKAIALYNAVLALLMDKKDISVLSVSMIAKKAGIGKATVYDYFESKEELVACALFYGYKNLLIEVHDELKNYTSLIDKIKCMVNYADKYKCVNGAIDFVKIVMNSVEELHPYIQKLFDEDQMIHSYIEEFIKDMMDALIEETKNQITDYNMEYVQFIIMSILQAIFTPESCLNKNNNQQNRDKKIKYYYQMMIGSVMMHQT